MNALIDYDDSPKSLVNRSNELELIKTAIDALIHNKNILSTPIINFFGIDGIGKTRILQEIFALCIANGLPCIKLDENQTQLDGSKNISRISHAILQQARKYRQKSQKQLIARKGDPHSQTVEAIKVLLAERPVVILLDAIDASNEALINWIKMTLHDLIRHDNLFVVLASKQQIAFENDWSIARKFASYRLKPLNHDDSMLYLKSLNDIVSTGARETIFQWTRGYPLAMEVITKAILQHRFDIENSEDQQELITIAVEEIIDKKVLAHVEPSQLEWYKAHLLLLSIPRRFNLIIMQELLEKFGNPPITKMQSTLEYLALPKQLNPNAGILRWDPQKVGYTIDESLRNILLVYQRIHNFSLFISINQYLAKKNMDIAKEVTGLDRVRYLRDYLYHSAQSGNNQAIGAIFQPIEQQFNSVSSDAKELFREEIYQDDELQEILGRQNANLFSLTPDSDTFIGRENEILSYEQWLTDANAPRILYFYDAASQPDKKGGVGKTRLLQECIQLTGAKYKAITIVNIDFFRITDRDGRRIAERVYSQLKKTYPGWLAESFARARKDDKNTTNSIEVRNKLSKALTSDLHDLDTYLRETGQEDQCRLLLVFDTFEVIQDNPSVAVLSPIQNFPDDYHFDHIRFLIAGRDAINWTQLNWQGRDQEIKSVALEPFTRDETVDYMRSNEIPLESGSPRAAILWELTGGRPILLGLIKDLLGLNAVTLEDLLAVPPAEFEKHLVSQINHIDQSINWFLLFMAHAYHRLNPSLLKWMLEVSSLSRFTDRIDERRLYELPKFSFVRRSTEDINDFNLHDEMRLLIMKYCWQNWDTDKSFRREVSHCMIQYYEEALEQEHDDLIRQTYIVQILYHKAFLDINDGLQYFTHHFDRAIDLWQNAHARTLLQEIQKFTDLLSPHQRADLVMEEARLFLKEENREMALAYHEQLLDEAETDWVEEHKTEIFYNLGECHLAMAEFQEAASSFNDALALERERDNQEKIADILNALGYISRCQGQFEQAVDYYQESFRIYKRLGKQPEYLRELADILNNLGNVYRLLGKIDEALIYVHRGLQIRERLASNNEVSEVAIGFSHATLGYIYLYDGNDASAENHLKIALDAFTRTSNKKGLAACHNRLGLIEIKRENLAEALKHFQIAFEEAMHTDEEAQVTSLNRQAQIHCLHEEFEDAREDLEKAVTLAQKVHDSYQETEARIDLARLSIHMKDFQSYTQELKVASKIAEQRQYNKLLGEIERLRGDHSYQQQKHLDAFLHYAKLCRFMTQYNPIEYRKALHFLTDKLFELLKADDSAEVTKVLEILHNYWEEQQLASTFPEFLRVCDNVGEVNS